MGGVAKDILWNAEKTASRRGSKALAGAGRISIVFSHAGAERNVTTGNAVLDTEELLSRVRSEDRKENQLFTFCASGCLALINAVEK